MFNPFRLWRNYKHNKELETDTLNGVFYYEIIGRCLTKVDPMLAYVKLKEHGFDVFGEEIEGVKNASPTRTRAFLKAVCETFDLTEYDPKANTGITVHEALSLYFAFFRYLSFLKKKLWYLQEYLPSLDDRLNALSQGTHENSDSTDDSSKSDSTSTSSTAPQPQDSQVSTEPEERSQEST